jgi:inosine/xanthosine triphosphatase
MEPQGKEIHTSQEMIVVASKNPVKISAALEGFSRMFPNSAYTAHGVSVASGVSDQPLSNDETLLGAKNRVQNARSLEPDADYWIGIEGGIASHDDSFQTFAWIVVMDKKGLTGKSRTSSHFMPEEVVRLVREGMELGDADDEVFGHQNSKQRNGSAGLLTGDVIDRSAVYVQAVILALIPFKNPHLMF